MERLDVVEAVFGLLPGGDIAVAAPDDDGDPVAIECGQGVFQPDSELADDLVRVGQLLLVLVLSQVLVAEPAASVPDVPAVIDVPEDLRFRRPGEGLLVEGVGDHLAQGVRYRPVLQHPLDVEVELSRHDSPHRHGGRAQRSVEDVLIAEAVLARSGSLRFAPPVQDATPRTCKLNT